MMDKNTFKQAIFERNEQFQEDIESWMEDYLVEEASKQDLLGNNTIELTEDNIPQDDSVTLEMVSKFLVSRGFSVTEVSGNAMTPLGKTLIVGWE